MSLGKRKCKICKEEFEKQQPMQFVCSPLCGIEYTKRQKEKKAEEARVQAAKAERAKTKAKKRELETVGDLIKKAQKVFNQFIRLRDKGQPCISCGVPLQAGFGGGYDAGHYRSIGSAAHLRFDEANCHGQCKKCNRYLSGNAVSYRVNLIEKIGLAEVERLESENTPRKWSKDELRELELIYKQKIKDLERGNV